MMIYFGVGVADVGMYNVKKSDRDYSEEEQLIHRVSRYFNLFFSTCSRDFYRLFPTTTLPSPLKRDAPLLVLSRERSACSCLG
jgi:hypothetical protein